ncbi:MULTISPECIES: sugar phosphate isomerase/epimerase [unclassified Actinomyces]|uniref:sugar phosphate isomerase/epimerase family protein n=1 Tax=unclassified Actinomyces TaxID=2609248 RepID=UPI000D59455D|nr:MULTISPECIES: sugar phosphate isomerase/epimerase [unclassified Actinomyces]RAX18996.1 sugar phosphate isomerase [Actinomyces sp. Z3]RAX24418.1 sugar phosphate isomerase [Actinomyces sp. Z5]
MIRWSYALNQFKPQFDHFVRRRQHERALRVVSISGFSGVELNAGTGRWEPLGNPTQLAANFGSIAGFRRFVQDAGLESVSSWFWDPAIGYQEDLTHGDDPLDPGSRDGLVAHAAWLSEALAELGGSVLVVRPAPYAGHSGPLDDAALQALADSWNAVGAAIAPMGVRLGLHFDFLSSLRTADALDSLLALTDPELTGLALDTAEFVVAGRNPLEFIEHHADRVIHVHLKNAADVDNGEEYLNAGAEYSVLRAGGKRGVGRWFTELAEEPVLVDAAAVMRALTDHGYAGWIVVESDMSPHPASSTMLNGWEVQHVLKPIADSSD